MMMHVRRGCFVLCRPTTTASRAFKLRASPNYQTVIQSDVCYAPSGFYSPREYKKYAKIFLLQNFNGTEKVWVFVQEREFANKRIS